MHWRGRPVHAEGEAVMRESLLNQDATASCDTVDALPIETRHLVHEFGYSVVRAFDDAGIRDPRKIRRLVHAVWIGAAEPGNRACYKLGQRIAPTLSVALGAGRLNTVPALVQFLRSSHMVMVPREPMPAMVAASIAETAKLGVVSKQQKHHARLRAALRAAEAHLYPELTREDRE